MAQNGAQARTYVVTGSSSGIGAATAALLRASGARVLGVDRSAGPLTSIEVDVSTTLGRDDLTRAVRVECPGHLDAVIACAGVAYSGGLTASVNYFGALETVTRLRPLMASASAPRAVVTSSYAIVSKTSDEIVAACLAGDEALAAQLCADELQTALVYPSTKLALSTWVTRTAVTEPFAGQGITLNAVAPGIVNTPMLAEVLANPERRVALESQIPMPLGQCSPHDVARVLIFLASEACSHVTGQTIFVDGGADAVRRSSGRVRSRTPQ